MSRTLALLTSALCLPFVASGQDVLRSMVDRTRLNIESSGGMELDAASGKLEMTRVEWRQLLGDTVRWNDFSMIGLAQYRGTFAETEGAPATYALQSETLHLLSLQGVALHQTEGSKWLYGGWGCIELASDFQDFNSDAFTFDAAIGLAYRVSDRLIVGGGAGILDLNGNEFWLPAPVIQYRPDDEWTLGIYGPTIDATWSDRKFWKISWRGEMGGGLWNREGAGGVSENLEIRSYQVGMHLQRHIHGQVWFALGTGITTSNKIEVSTPEGSTKFKDHPNGGWFVYAGLRAYEW